MTALTPDQIAAKWAQNLSASTSNMQAGISAVSVAPGQAAARQKSAYVQGVTASQDKWAANVSRVTLQEWQQAFIQKGLPRIATGAAQAQPGFTSFMSRLLPHIASVKGSLPPRGNIDQNIARSAAMIRGMAAFRNS